MIPTIDSDVEKCLVSWADPYIPLKDVWATEETLMVVQTQLA